MVLSRDCVVMCYSRRLDFSAVPAGREVAGVAVVVVLFKLQSISAELSKYIIPDEGEHWVNKTLNDAWRVHKSRMKAKHFYGKDNCLKTDEERIKNRPSEIPLEDFKILLAYWGDEEVQKLAEENTARRNSLTETHTMGPETLAQVRNKLKKSDPKLASPSDANVFLETRKREDGRKYKTNTDALKTKCTEIIKLVSSGKDADADAMVNCDKDHGRGWLVGRAGKSCGSKLTSTPCSYRPLCTGVDYNNKV